MLFRSQDREKVLGLARLTDADQIPQWKLGFKLCRQFLKQGATVGDLDQLQKDAQLVYEYLQDFADQAQAKNKDHAYLCKMRVKNSDNEQFDFITHVAKEFLKKYLIQEEKLMVGHKK